MPRPKQVDGDSLLVKMNANLIRERFESTGKRFRNKDFQVYFNVSQSTVFKSLSRLVRNREVISARRGVDTFYFLVVDSERHLIEIDQLNDEASKRSKDLNRERTKKRYREKSFASRSSLVDLAKITKGAKLFSTRENPSTRTGTIRYFKYMNNLKCEGVKGNG